MEIDDATYLYGVVMSARLWTTTLAMLLTIGAFGCERGDKPQTQPAHQAEETQANAELQDDLTKKGRKIGDEIGALNERLDTMGDDLNEDALNSLKKITSKLDELRSEIESLQERVDGYSGEAKKEFRSAMKELRSEWRTVNNHTEEMRSELN